MTLDGIPIYVSSAMTANHALVGNFASARIHVRQAPVVQTSESDADDFVENKIKFRAEERVALAVPHLNAFVDLTLAS